MLTEILKQNHQVKWDKGYQHPFVQTLGAGTLDPKSFEFYLIQDYHYLLNYTRIFALAASKTRHITLLKQYTQVQHSILFQELAIHQEYLKSFGVDFTTVQNTQSSIWNKAYTNYMLSIAHSGDDAEIITALLPCAWTYYDFALRLKQENKSSLFSNPYRSWVEGYAGEEYLNSFKWMFHFLNEEFNPSTEKIALLQEIFGSSLEFEYQFWEMSYHQSL